MAALMQLFKGGEIMKTGCAIVLTTSGLLLAGAAEADAGLELAKQNNCTVCHAVDKKLLGPAYMEVAKKYAGDQTADEKLVEKVKKGGSGVWGTVAMPPNTNVSDEDVKALVKWILSLK